MLRYGHRYRRWILDSLKYIDVQDLATSGDHVPELSELQVDVALAGGAAHAGDRAEDSSGLHSIGELLGRSPAVLVIIGQPGSGKSTLLAQAAQRNARTALRGRPARRRIPILLTLRKHAESIVANPEISLPQVVRDAVGDGPGKEPGGWWERRLRRGRCLVLLDGLDEIARAGDRLAVTDWVRRQIAAQQGNCFVVTSRPYGLPDPLTTQAEVFLVRPFTPDQVRLFLDRWYLAAERHATGGSGRSAQRAVQLRARGSAARLTTLLGQHPALGDLAANPLLLTMIAAAHRYRGALPDSRADLYAEICHVLLSRRGQSKDLPELLPWHAKQALLATLAYQMMRDHVSSLPADRVVEILGPVLERFPPSVSCEAFLEDVARNGMFLQGPPGTYSFAHLTFQEYLAARHVSASPDLLKVLADNVGDPWWHETILLYAATADASPIVRACLASGTIPALTLAFDCGAASTEIDPELRQRLELERHRAFEPDCPAEHRRLIAGVEATRLTRQTLTSAAGTRVCARPVAADLYWLFLADTKVPAPDGPSDPRADQPATGVWATQAHAFVKWLNSITATATGIAVRLPSHEELQDEAVASALSDQLPASVTCAWAQPAPQLWLRPGQPHPHELSGATLSQAMVADAEHTAIVPRILSAAVVNVALGIIRDLDDARALSDALDNDLTARGNSGGRTVELMHAHAHAIVLTYDHALGLTRADAITRTCAADPDLIRTLDVGDIHDLASTISHDLAGAINLARDRAVELAEAIDLDQHILSAFDFDVDHAIGLARVHRGELDQARLLARGAAGDREPDLARLLGITGAGALDPTIPLPAILGLPMRWVADGPLASTALQVLTETGNLHLAFARMLLSRAGIDETTRLRAALHDRLTDTLGDIAAAGSRNDASQATALRLLSDAYLPISGTHQPPDPAEAAALRLVAIALAATAEPGSGTPDVMRTVAATVTLIENRRKGEATTGESIILALA